MHPAIRSQADGPEARDGEAFSSGVFNEDEDPTRQEFAQEADINFLLKRFIKFGEVPAFRPLEYGEIDFDVGLQEALSRVSEAREAWDRLPESIRSQYGNWAAVMRAVEAGELVSLDEMTQPAVTPQQVTTPSAEGSETG